MSTDPEFTFCIKLDEIPKGRPLEKEVTANDTECAALSKRFDVQGLKDVTAQLVLVKQGGGHIIKVEGRFTAHVTQECIVTLAPVLETVEGQVEAYYTDIAPVPSLAQEVEMQSESDAPEFIKDGKIDIGELVAQHIALEINPYPRAEGVEFDPEQAKSGDTANPFAVLKVLKSSDE